MTIESTYLRGWYMDYNLPTNPSTDMVEKIMLVYGRTYSGNRKGEISDKWRGEKLNYIIPVEWDFEISQTLNSEIVILSVPYWSFVLKILSNLHWSHN